MTLTHAEQHASVRHGAADDEHAALDQTPPSHHPYRWRMNRAGLVDAWFYYDTEFDLSGGRLVLRGTNGSGKSRALELLLPFLLDADRRKMDATGSGKVSLVELMKAGAEDRTTRAGYLWLELARTIDPHDPAHATGATEQHLTIGAHVRFSRATGDAKVHYFTTDLRVGRDLQLLSPARETLPREKLADLIGADRITSSPSVHRDRVRAAVFTLTGDSGAERYAGLLQLLHTLRSPDVGNRIEEGKLPQILSEALPPLNEGALNAAGEQLDGLSETRAAQTRLETALGQVNTFLGTYHRYAASVIAQTAEQTLEAAAAAETAAKDAKVRARQHADLETARAEKNARLGELVDTLAELESTIAGIKQSAAYADARDLDEREKKIEALGSAADTALNTAHLARAAEERDVRAADEAAEAARTAGERAEAALQDTRATVAAAGATGTLPASIRVDVIAPAATTDTVRLTREDDPAPFPRPVPATLAVTPDDPDPATDQIRRVHGSVTERRRQADGRRATAAALVTQRAHVEEAQRQADAADERAREFEDTAALRQTDLDQTAVAYADQWRTWANAPATRAAFDGIPDLSSTPIADIIDGPDLSALDLADDDLAHLDRVADDLAATAAARHHHTIADLDAADREASTSRSALRTERAQLESAVDPHPARPGWLAPTAPDAVPLWQTIDFGPDLNDADRAGLEGALLASGLLLATVHADGTVRAEDGQLLLTPTGPLATHPVTSKLVADPASPVAADVVDAVLTRIGYHDQTARPALAGHPRSDGTAPVDPNTDPETDPGTDPGTDPETAAVWIATDGSWGAGPLTGRHLPASARHIGAAARAAARRARLDAIDAELTDLAAAEDARAADRSVAKSAIASLREAAHSAPRTQPIASARVRADDAITRATKERAAAHAAAANAEALRTQWSQENNQHRAICAELGLPHTVADLEQVRQHAGDAATSCQRLLDLLASVGRSVDAHRAAVARAAERTRERADIETRAARDWSAWHREAAEFESVRANIGQEAAAAKAELRACQTEQRTLATELEEVRAAESRLGQQVGSAEVEARNAEERVRTTHTSLVDAAEQLRRRLALPGIAAAAFTAAPSPLEVPEVTPAAVQAAVAQVSANLRRHGQVVDDNALIRPQQNLERELSGTYDVIAEVRDGVRLVELSDATGQRTIADAAAELARTVEDGRTALTERERRVFTEFVLGGVSEELRRRLDQAEDLIGAMNASLSTIRTSHGIGVKLRWKVAESADPTIARIKELVSTAGAVRAAEQTSELTELLKARVDEAFALDESAGYATHLREALDYRSWHVVEVIILGPKPGQERRISRKARLSQGETRFVSYVTLFAAIDAYLSGLPDTSRALRLLLLDDAFAKVDDRTIGELMGLLVRLDIDFAMTGHALWGMYPQVPNLDCYEVRRVEGSSAVTTHTHWDGRTRHLRPTR